MSTKKRNIIIGVTIGVMVVVLGTVAYLGIFRGFTPEKYVDAILDQTFKGDVNAVLQLTEGATEKQLKAQYESGIESFVKNTIAGGAEMDEKLEDKYIKLCKKIFDDMKYDVTSSKSTKNGHEVTVEYQVSDVWTKYIELSDSVTKKINEKMENGDYRGTLDEINAEMRKDFLIDAYDVLEKAYKDMQYGEKKTVAIQVQKGKGDLYELKGEEISQFIKKIMGLDENQD